MEWRLKHPGVSAALHSGLGEMWLHLNLPEEMDISFWLVARGEALI